MAPVGLLWTPGYWGWNDGAYLWNDGYWGPTVGFYGGINYGFGYTGAGYFGGEWRGGAFFYNSAVMNVRGTRITNVYERNVEVNNSHVAFNGGEGGISARPSAEQERFAHEHHTAAVAAQREQMRDASHNRALFASSTMAGCHCGHCPCRRLQEPRSSGPGSGRRVSCASHDAARGASQAG